MERSQGIPPILRLLRRDLCSPNVTPGGCSHQSRSVGLPQIEHLYGLTVFENYLYATNSDEGNLNPKTSVIRVNRFNSSDFQVVTRVDRGAALHVYHQRRQPQGKPVFGLFPRLPRVLDALLSSSPG